MQTELDNINSINNKLKKITHFHQGKISFQKVSFRYRKDQDLVLKNVSFDILPKEKIACIGRTGSGKSSLCYTLFRFINL